VSQSKKSVYLLFLVHNFLPDLGVNNVGVIVITPHYSRISQNRVSPLLGIRAKKLSDFCFIILNFLQFEHSGFCSIILSHAPNYIDDTNCN
jgi:hypothetical protein